MTRAAPLAPLLENILESSNRSNFVIIFWSIIISTNEWQENCKVTSEGLQNV